MTSKSFNSVTLSFDHFAPKGYKHRYVAMVSRKIYLNQTYNLFRFSLTISIKIFLAIINYSSEKLTKEELLPGSIRNNLRMICVALDQETRHLFVSMDYCQIQFTWLESQYTQIILCGASEKRPPR